MPAGAGVGVGVGDGLEEMDALPPQAQITAETHRRIAEGKMGERLEVSEELIGGCLFTERIGLSKVSAS